MSLGPLMWGEAVSRPLFGGGRRRRPPHLAGGRALAPAT